MRGRFLPGQISPKSRPKAKLPLLNRFRKHWAQIAQSYMNNPTKLMEEQQKLWSTYGMIWQNSWARALGAETDPIAVPARSDRRFKDKDWQQNSIFDFLKQIYVASSDWAQKMVADAEGRRRSHATEGTFLRRANPQRAFPVQFPCIQPRSVEGDTRQQW